MISTSFRHPTPSIDSPFISITWLTQFRITVVGADRQTSALIKSLVKNTWPEKATALERSNGIVNIRITESADFSFQIRNLCIVLLENLRVNGWILYQSADLTRIGHFTTWFLKRNEFNRNDFCAEKSLGGYKKYSRQLSYAKIISIGLSSYNKISVLHADKTVINEIKQAIYPYEREYTSEPNQCTFTISGRPWENKTFEHGIIARKIIVKLFTNMSKCGYKYYGSCKPKGNTDTLFFIQDLENKSKKVKNENICLLSLNVNNKFRLINFPYSKIPVVRIFLERTWPGGLVHHCAYSEGVYEMTLHGSPWRCKGEDACEARSMLCKLLEELRKYGLQVVCSLELSRNLANKSVLVLKHVVPAIFEHFALAPTSINKIKLINAPTPVKSLFAELLKKHWALGVELHKNSKLCDNYALNGRPWANPNEKTNITDWQTMRNFLSIFLTAINEKGWEWFCSVDVSSKFTADFSNSMGLDTLLFVKPLPTNYPLATSKPPKSLA